METTHKELTRDQKRKILIAQKTELTEHFIYLKLANSQKNENNRRVFARIADEEFEHQKFWQNITGQELKPNRFKIWFYFLTAKIFGVTFGIKLMEKGEQRAERAYKQLLPILPQIQQIIEDENKHEQSLIALLDEERLKYVSSMVLGLNDALVELIGALAGLTLALQQTSLVVLAGSITGIAAAMSMAASEYLSTKAEEASKNPTTAAVYTGIAYLLTVIFLVSPYLIFPNPFVCLGVSVINALVVIVVFTYYISIAKDLTFKKRFGEMAMISMGIAVINFLIGLGIRNFLHVDV